MLARKCDRCGKLYESYKGRYKGRYKGAYNEINGVTLVNIEIDRSRVVSDIYDLCPECMKNLMLFIVDPDAEVIGEIKQEKSYTTEMEK